MVVFHKRMCGGKPCRTSQTLSWSAYGGIGPLVLSSGARLVQELWLALALFGAPTLSACYSYKAVYDETLTSGSLVEARFSQPRDIVVTRQSGDSTSIRGVAALEGQVLARILTEHRFANLHRYKLHGLPADHGAPLSQRARSLRCRSVGSGTSLMRTTGRL